jgi:hypothetical protein
MKKEIQFLIGFILTLNFMFGQKQTAEFVNQFFRDKDTLAIYEQFIHDDTLRVIKHQYYFNLQDELIVQRFYTKKYRQKKIRLRTWKRKLDELYFDYISDCIIPKKQGAFLSMETMIRNTKRHNPNCKTFGQIAISIDKKIYSTKSCTCGQATYLYFKYSSGCPIKDNSEPGSIY